MYKVKFSKNVDKFLESHRDYAKIFIKKIELLLENPYKNTLDIWKYEWRNNSYRLRIWKYRFLYEIINNELLIYFFKADSRGDVYK